MSRLETFKPGKHPCSGVKHFYSLDGTSHKSPELVFRKLSNFLSVSHATKSCRYGTDSIGRNAGKVTTVAKRVLMYTHGMPKFTKNIE